MNHPKKNNSFKTPCKLKNLKTLFLYSLLLFQTLSERDDKNYCSKDMNRYNELKIHKLKTLGEGSFGIVYGDGEYALKQMVIKKNISDKASTNHEIAAMLGFDSYDISKTIPQGCWTWSREKDMIVWLTMLQYDSDLDKLRRN